MSTMPVAARPGTTYFAPGARIMMLGRRPASGREAGTDLPFVAADLMQVEVTRVNTGASQYSITLNNFYDSLPKDRREGLGEDERLVEGRPLWPRFKYNTFERLAFGDRLRIDMRYWPDPVAGLDAATRSVQSWVPMVAGPITDMKFTFSAGAGAQVIVSGEDDLSRLKDKPEERVDLPTMSEESMVSRVLQEADYGLELASDTTTWPDFATDDSQGLNEALQDGQSYLDFLQKLADRLDFEVFLEFADLTDPDSGVAFHFEPARSLVPPETTLRDIYVLKRDTNLIEFSPTIKVIDQYTGTVVKGRHRDRNRPDRVAEPADPEVIDQELHVDPAQNDRPLRAGPLIRQKYFADRPNKAEAPNQSNLDEARARQMAVAMLRKKAREFMTIEGTTLGLPRLRPGNHVEIRGMREPFDGFFYVTKTVHSFGSDGFRTRFTARRPGMPEPPYTEA